MHLKIRFTSIKLAHHLGVKEHKGPTYVRWGGLVFDKSRLEVLTLERRKRKREREERIWEEDKEGEWVD